MSKEVWTTLKTVAFSMAIAFVSGVASAPYFESNRLKHLVEEVGAKRDELRRLQDLVSKTESDLDRIRSDVTVTKSELSDWQSRHREAISIRADDFDEAMRSAGLQIGDACADYCSDNVEFICEEYASDYASDYLSENCVTTEFDNYEQFDDPW
ncbi:MAG: hypothetical protein R3D59_05860 [Paracoccaceae bacterium]